MWWGRGSQKGFPSVLPFLSTLTLMFYRIVHCMSFSPSLMYLNYLQSTFFFHLYLAYDEEFDTGFLFFIAKQMTLGH